MNALENRLVRRTLGIGFACLACACAALPLRGAAITDDAFDLVKAVAGRLGKTQEETAAYCASGECDSGYDAKACFDGVYASPTGGTADRWYGSLSKGPYVDFTTPEEIPTDIFLVGYRVRRLSTGWYSRDRAPTAWVVEGSNDGTNWTEIDAQSGVEWGGTQTYNSADKFPTQPGDGVDPDVADCVKEFVCTNASRSFRRFRFRPTASNHLSVNNVKSTNVGLHEIEYLCLAQGNGLCVRHGIAADDTSGFSCADNEVLSASADVFAPETVTNEASLVYNCTGCTIEMLDLFGFCTNVTTNAVNRYRYTFAQGDLLRLTWLWRLQGTARETGYGELIRALDEPFATEGGVAGVDFINGQGPDRCFDGITLTADSLMRYTAKVGSHVALLVGGERFGDMAVVPVRYRLWQHSTGWYCNERAPTAWKFEGSNDGLNWVVLDEVRDYSWYAQTNSAVYGSGLTAKSPWEKNASDAALNCVERELQVTEQYLSYRLTMQNAAYMKGTGQEWDIGLMEVEILVRGESKAGADGHLTVVNNMDAAISTPPSGVYQVSKSVGGIDCSAQERVFRDGRLYSCRGYAVEVDSGDGWSAPVTNLGARAYRYVQGKNEVRLTWLWEHVANRISVSNENGGETLTYSPAADYEDPDEPGVRYYAVGKTIEVAFDTTTAPTPSRFTGEIVGDTNGVAVAADRLTLSSGEPHRITAYFERHWKYLSPEENGGAEAVTDGNWTLAVANARPVDIVDTKGNVYARAGEYLCFTAGVYRAGCGRLDLTLLNTDLAAQRATESRALPLLWLGNGAFANVSQLTELIVPADIVGGFCAPFQFCENLVSVSFAPSFEYWVIQLYESRFGGWDVAENQKGVFDHCLSLVRASLPNARRIPPYAFDYCSSLKAVELSPRLEEIGYRAFGYCLSLSAMGRIELPRTFSRFGKDGNELGAFQGARLDVLDISRVAVTNIPDQTFSECLFNRIILPKKLKRVGRKAFEYTFEVFKPTELEILEFTGKSPPEMADEWLSGFAPNCIAALVPGNYADLYMAQEAAGKSVFVPKDKIPKITTLPNYDAVAAYGKHFLGSWYGTWLLSASRQGLMIFLK